VTERQHYVYIASNESRTLYTGVTSNLERRTWEHRWKVLPGFTSKYNIAKLVYCEATSDVRVAIEREKQIKGWVRAKKIALIEAANPDWQDLSLEWFAQGYDEEILRLRAQNDRNGSAAADSPTQQRT
jgi:putative endonuclease